MTHSMYRQGTYENLHDDFIVITSAGRAFPDLPARMSRFREIGFRHAPVNVPGVNSLISARHLVYDTSEKLRAFLHDLAAADLGLCVLVSGLSDRVREICREIRLTPHTVNQSLGIWGKTSLLPPPRVLDITTMCGHGRVTPHLVWDLADRVRRHQQDAGAAARQMGCLCRCNIFNEVRAARLLEELVADIEAGIIVAPTREECEVAGRKESGITIDAAKCTRCLECLAYCPVSAIAVVPSTGEVRIDAGRCYECGLCYQVQVCPVDAIVPMDLNWPRSLRGKFQSLYAPYRASPSLLPADEPVCYSEEIVAVHKNQLPSEHTNDVTGLLRHGAAEIVVELGRPHLGATFHDVQKVVQALLPMGLRLDRQYPVFDERSPLVELAADAARGSFRRGILDERVGWLVLKLVVPEGDVPGVVRSLRKVAGDIDTVFAVGIVSRVAPDGTTVAERWADATGVKPAVNGKTNVGLGRPLAKE